jgi:hypothetical protein
VTPVRILYGYPTAESFERAGRGEIVLGGCVLTGDDPEWACPACRNPVATTMAVRPVEATVAEGR